MKTGNEALVRFVSTTVYINEINVQLLKCLAW